MSNPYAAPQSEVEEFGNDHLISRVFTYHSTWVVFIICFLTSFVYLNIFYIVYWFQSRTAKFNTIVKPHSRIGGGFSTIVYISVVAFIASLLLFVYTALNVTPMLDQNPDAFTPQLEQLMVMYFVMLGSGLCLSVLLLVWTFKIRNRLIEVTRNRLDVNGILTFFFNIFYLNFKINEAIEMERRGHRE